MSSAIWDSESLENVKGDIVLPPWSLAEASVGRMASVSTVYFILVVVLESWEVRVERWRGGVSK